MKYNMKYNWRIPSLRMKGRVLWHRVTKEGYQMQTEQERAFFGAFKERYIK